MLDSTDHLATCLPDFAYLTQQAIKKKTSSRLNRISTKTVEAALGLPTYQDTNSIRSSTTHTTITSLRSSNQKTKSPPPVRIDAPYALLHSPCALSSSSSKHADAKYALITRRLTDAQILISPLTTAHATRRRRLRNGRVIRPAGSADAWIHRNGP